MDQWPALKVQRLGLLEDEMINLSSSCLRLFHHLVVRNYEIPPEVVGLEVELCLVVVLLQAMVTEDSRQGRPSQHWADYYSLEPLVALAWSRLLHA